MSTLFKTSVLVSCCIAAAIGSTAQLPPPPPAEAPGIRPPLPGRPAPERPLQQLTSVSGTVAAYTANVHSEYDGCTLQNSGQTVNVHFPAPMGARLMKEAPKGGTLTVQGFYETSPEGVQQLHLVTAKVGSVLITDTLPAPPVPPAAEVLQSFSGTIRLVQRNQEGNVDAILINDKQRIDLPPAAAVQLQQLLQTGQSLSGTGSKLVYPAGVVTVNGMQTIRPQTLTLNGQTYLVR